MGMHPLHNCPTASSEARDEHAKKNVYNGTARKWSGERSVPHTLVHHALLFPLPLTRVATVL